MAMGGCGEGDELIRGKIDLIEYGLIREYKPLFGRWLTVIYAAPILVFGYFVFSFYSNVHLTLSPHGGWPDAEAIAFLFAGAFVLVFVFSAIIDPGKVLLFQEGVYVHPGWSGIRDPSRRPGFLMWEELRGIVRTPYRNGGMSLLGKNPADEVILPKRLFKKYDDIQEDVRHIGPNMNIRIIDLRAATNRPVAEYGSFVLGWWHLAPSVPLIVGLFKVLLGDINIVVSDFVTLGSLNRTIFLLPVISGCALLFLLGGVFYSYRSGNLTYRFIVYREGILSIQSGMVSFARWEEIRSIEKVKPGIFKLNPIDDKMKAAGLNVGKQHSDDFERVMKRLGRMVG